MLSDYQNRVFDMTAFLGAKSSGDTLLTQALFTADTPGAICTGVQKLAQRWLLTFMTKEASMTFQPTLGTDFMTQASYGFRTETDAITAFELAKLQAAQQLINEESDTWNNEDRYSVAELESVTLSTTSMFLRIKITSLAGTIREVILPVSTMPISTRK